MGRERSAFHPGPESFHSNQGRIHERRPTLSLTFFACNSAADHTGKSGHPSTNSPTHHVIGQFTRLLTSFLLHLTSSATITPEVLRCHSSGCWFYSRSSPQVRTRNG